MMAEEVWEPSAYLRRRPHDTEVEAAEAARETSVSQRARVYAYLWDCGSRGATDEEVQIALGMAGNTERPRRLELVERRLAFGSEARRLTTKGLRAIVWLAIPQRKPADD